MQLFGSSKVLIWRGLYIVLFLSGVIFLFWSISARMRIIQGTLPWAYQKSLQSEVDETLRNEDGHYGVVVKHLLNGEEARLNADEQMLSASLYKLAVLYTAYRQMDAGVLSLDETLEMTTEAAAQVDDEEPSLPVGSSTTVRDAIYQMITVSDNASAILLLQRIGQQKVNQMVYELGLRQTEVGVSDFALTSPGDILLLLEKIYEGPELSENARQEILAVLLQQKVNDRLPRYLPAGTPVAHKTGDLFDLRHDAGIVYAPNGPYIIIVMTHDLPNIERGMEATAQLSRRVFDYFSKLDT